jgi:hypothetical protein
LALRSISAHGRVEFGGKPILFVGDLRRLSQRFPFPRRLLSISSSQTFLIGLEFENFQLQQPLRGQDHVWNGFLLSIADGQIHNIEDWRKLGQQFFVTVTQPSQSPGLSSVSVCRPLLSYISIVSKFMLRTNA